MAKKLDEHIRAWVGRGGLTKKAAARHARIHSNSANRFLGGEMTISLEQVAAIGCAAGIAFEEQLAVVRECLWEAFCEEQINYAEDPDHVL